MSGTNWFKFSRHKQNSNIWHSDDGFKYFIDCKEDDIVKPLYIIFPQITGYIKYFKNKGKYVFCD